jgi:hypothetical protein
MRSLDTSDMEKVLDTGDEATFSTGYSKSGWSSTICALRHKSGEPSAYYVDVGPIPVKGKKNKYTGQFQVSVKKVTKDCDEKQVYAGRLKLSEFHSSNIPDNEDGPNYVDFGRYSLLISADHSWVLGIVKKDAGKE